MHILKDQIHLRHRPWHFKVRFNIADHMVARYNAGEPTAFPPPPGTSCWSTVQMAVARCGCTPYLWSLMCCSWCMRMGDVPSAAKLLPRCLC